MQQCRIFSKVKRNRKTQRIHCVKSVRFRSYSGPNAEKIRTRITSNTYTFYAVIVNSSSEVYAEPCHNEMKHFATILNDQKSLTIFAGSSIIDVSQGSEYTNVISNFLNASVRRYMFKRYQNNIYGCQRELFWCQLYYFEQIFSSWD